jgi:hypothetical protein
MHLGPICVCWANLTPFSLQPAVVASVDREDYYPADAAGFWEQCVDAGDDVAEGELLGRVRLGF